MHRISGRVRFSSTPFIFFFASWCTGAYAQTLVHFDLPAQSLARSLNEIGTATNTDVGFSATQVAGLLAPPLKADLTVDGALARVLIGTGLRPKHLDDHTIVIATMEAIERSVPTGPRADLLHIAKVADNSTQQMPAQTDTPVPHDVTNSSGNVSPSPHDDLEEVVVTGTHIRGIDNKTNPIIVIDRDQIDRSGYSSTQDLFRSLPQNFTSGDANADGIYSGNAQAARNADYGSGVNLRGLGPSSTLVLLNGHRLAPSAVGSFVDVSLIPLAAVDRVEILTDGSSAIYGSDAVGGVVNIILKKDYRGADTTARFGDVTDGSRHEELLAQTLGTAWSSGNIVGTLQYQQQSALPSSDRDFASALPSPNDLLPKTRSYSATLDGRQTLAGGLEFYGDVLLSKRDFIRGYSQFEGSHALDIVYATHADGIAEAVDVTPGLRYQFSDRWSVELNGLYGRQLTTEGQDNGVPSTPLTNLSERFQYTEESADLIVNGRVTALPAGNIGLAAGVSYRTEDLDAMTAQTPSDVVMTQGEHRHIAAAFGELYVPIVGRENQIPLVEALELSAAVRRDHYSDFGSTTNPRIGLRWAVWKDLSFRASYGKSFRAPSAAEELSGIPSLQLIASYPPILASPNGGLTSALVEGGSKALTAERARTEDFSIEYKPSGIEGFTLNVGFYDIRYTDRIITPSFSANALIEPNVYGSLLTPVPNDAAAQAIIDAAVAAGSQFLNFSGTGATGIRYFLDIRQQNAAAVDQNGFDITSRYSKPIGSHTLIAQLNMSFTDKIDTQLSQGATFLNLVNTLANPAKWRGRLDLAWASNGWSVGGALNAVGSYVNTATVGNPSVASWTTVDLNATIDADAYFQSAGWHGVSLSLIALNALNRDPPFVDAAGLFRVNYDPSNASPLGRFLALTIKKKW
jgi:outer membrane receptor protein involved in Fe transport